MNLLSFIGSLFGRSEKTRDDLFNERVWRSLGGVISTNSGEDVTKQNAMRYSAVWCATRIISETMMTFPLSLMERVDERQRRAAIENPLYFLLHDEPNPMMDSAMFFDFMVPMQLNWGNAYAEIVRNDMTGRVEALYPIHPSRVPLSLIERDELGFPVYHVANDDGTFVKLPARNMLHIAGVLNEDGLTGKSVIEWGAESIGLAKATENTVGSFFRNGMGQSVVLSHPGTLGPEAAVELRSRWQQTYGGSDNKYKAVVLEEGMEAKTISVSPEQAQLLEARNFSVGDIARWYRLPPHMLGDLSRSTFSNIESQNISFVVQSMIPWVERWEKGLKRQLLDDEERRTMYFKFNMNSLLRGDSSTRSEFYRTGITTGYLSVNDVRLLEDMNPVDGGDVYYFPSNNLTPVQDSGSEQDQGDGNADDETIQLAESALDNVFVVTMQGLIGYESRHAKQALGNPREYESKIDAFYENKFRYTFIDSMQPIVETYKEFGGDYSMAGLVDEHIKESKRELDSALDVPMDQFEGKVAEIVDGWTERPQQALKKLKGKSDEKRQVK